MASDKRAARAAVTSATAGQRQPHRLRNVVLIVGAFVLVLGAVTGGVLALLAFDKSTSIDRSTPQVVTSQFLNAALKLHDSDRLALFTCSSWTAAEAMAAAGPPTQQQVTVSWGDTVSQTSGDSATTNVNVQFISVSPRVRYAEQWTLELRNEDGWRVCGLTRRSSLEP